MTPTPLDRAHAEMESSDSARLRFYERLADAELFLLLEQEAEGEQITPRLFPVDDQTLVLAFDREDRLASFAGQAPYAALSGRLLAGLLADQSLGLGLNLDVAPSAIVLEAEVMQWLHDTLAEGPKDAEATPEELTSPKNLPDTLITGLDAKLATAIGFARSAYLCGVRYQGGAQSHLLAFVDPVPGAEDALASAVNEALIFSGVEAGSLDVAFFRSTDPMAAVLAKVGLRFDLPEAIAPYTPSAPGMDPNKPPRLR